MINLGNTDNLTHDQRLLAVERALHSYPYFYRFEFDKDEFTAVDDEVFSQSVGIGRDFYYTESIGNFGLVHGNAFVGSLFTTKLYTAYLRSLYYSQSRKLPTGFVYGEGREPNSDAFCDRQNEVISFKIKQNDKMYTVLKLVDGAVPNVDPVVIAKGYMTRDADWLQQNEHDQIQESLNNPEMQWQVQSVLVPVPANTRGVVVHTIQNDHTPRLVLGLGALNLTKVDGQIVPCDIQIRDTSRRLQFTDKRIPLACLAPRQVSVVDTEWYYFPVEYYWQPYAKLEFDCLLDSVGVVRKPIHINILTRTI